MKRTKSIVALAVATSVTFSLAVPTFGNVFANRTPRVVVVEEVVEVVTPPTTQEKLRAIRVYPDLAVGSRAFLDNNSNVRGRLPVLSPAPSGSQYESVNAQFFTNMFRFHWSSADLVSGFRLETSAFGSVGAGPTAIASDFDGFVADFSVENQGRYAIITQTGNFGNAWDRITQKRPGGEFVTIINKATRMQATQAQLDAYMAEVEALRTQIEEEAAAAEQGSVSLDGLQLEEADMAPAGAEQVAEDEEGMPAEDEQDYLPLAPLSSAIDFGLEIVFNEEENLVELMFEGSLIAAFVVGSNVVVVGSGDETEIVQLSSETLLYEDGEVYAPLDFFTVALGLWVADMDIPGQGAETDAEGTETEE